MVLSANAVVNPWAVMIEGVAAFLALGAVTASWWFNDLAVEAELLGIVGQHELEKVFICFLFVYQKPWILLCKNNAQQDIHNMKTKLYENAHF